MGNDQYLDRKRFAGFGKLKKASKTKQNLCIVDKTKNFVSINDIRMIQGEIMEPINHVVTSVLYYIIFFEGIKLSVV